ncbi:hypothetical protein BJY00DRAFT_24578 [Aspergillus carlsbadensis]|nr:hypothetical protein BJY00DRAFT_24578 [Aspergillus carlsbadensis]
MPCTLTYLRFPNTHGKVFDVRYDNELAHQYYGDGEKLSRVVRQIYHDKGLPIPDEFDSTFTSPPTNFMQVSVPDGTDVDDLRKVQIPGSLSIEIMEFDDE